MGLLLLAKHYRGRPGLAPLLRAALAQPTLSTLGGGVAAGVAATQTGAPPPQAAAAPTAAGAGAGAGAGTAGGSGGEFAPDVIVVGSGVAGLTATLRLLDSGARVML